MPSKNVVKYRQRNPVVSSFQKHFGPGDLWYTVNLFKGGIESKALLKKRFPFSHPIFRPSSPAPQSQNPQNISNILVVLLNCRNQIWPEASLQKNFYIFARFIPADCVARRLHIPDMCPPRALSAVRLGRKSVKVLLERCLNPGVKNVNLFLSNA